MYRTAMTTYLSKLHRTISRQRLSCTLDRYGLMTDVAIVQDDRIEDVTTLDTSSCCTFQLAAAVPQIHGDFVHHETAASQAV